ncbi:uncharacterized protein G2W53_009675 [Senna tora]|uniref:Uncharacterized protein n=1 Tax=Senna tora TaxID=362788 RepID=A0A834WYJ2_9FABA|nr:uncharacterized protein G2W53_009675 [Senna tora]
MERQKSRARSRATRPGFRPKDSE